MKKVAMLTMRVKRFIQKTRRKLDLNGKETVGFDKTKVECYNYHRRGYFARECRAPKNHRNRNRDAPTRNALVDTSTTNALVIQDGIDKTGLGYDGHVNESKVLNNVVDSCISDGDDNQVKDRFNKSEGYHAVPLPYTRNYMPPRADLSFAGLDDYVFKSKVSETITSVPKIETNASKTTKTNNFNEKVNTAEVNNVTTAGPKAVVCVAEGNKNNAVKSSACWIWRPKGNDQGIFNSGCSRYMTGNKSYLTYYQKIDGGFVAFGGNAKGAKSVPFTDTECVVLSLDFKLLDESQVLLKVPRNNNMYSFDLKNVVPVGGLTCLFVKETIDESNLWHRRLGHINFKTINKLVRGNLTRGLPSKILKMTIHVLLVRRESNIKSPVRLRLFTWVFFLATKDETPKIVKNFIVGIENQMDHKVKTIKCDNRTKFKNRIMNEFCEMKGIRREFSVARTPSQNGVAERKNRTIIEAARTMLADSKLPTTFRAKAVNTACYFQRAQKTRLLMMLERKVLKFEEKRMEFGIQQKKVTKMIKKRMLEIKKMPLEINFNKNLKDCLIKRRNEFESKFRQDKDVNDNMMFTLVSFDGSTYVYLGGSILVNASTLLNADLPTDHPMPDLEDTADTRIFSGAYDDEIKGVEDDFNSLELTTIKVLRLVDLPKGKHAIGTKWVYRNKKDKRRIIVRNRGRLVAQGYIQEEGIDYDEVFAPVSKIEAIRLFLANASFMRFIVYQMDVKSAFLYGTIEEEVYVCRPSGFEDPYFPNKKSLCTEFEGLMHKKFLMSSMGELTFFLGLQVMHKDDRIFINQDKYVADILKKFDFSSLKIIITPIKNNKALLKNEEAEDIDVHLYRSRIGSLMYLTASRHDIMFAVCSCARFYVTPKILHIHVVKRIFSYLKGQPKLGLLYHRDSPFDLKDFSDSDYAGASLDQKSITRGCQFLRKRLISWQCKKQTLVSNSTTKPDYVAAANCYGQDMFDDSYDLGMAFVMNLEFKLVVEQRLVLHGCLDWIETTAQNEIQVSAVGLTYYCTMASAIICLANNKKFNFSKYIFNDLVLDLEKAKTTQAKEIVILRRRMSDNIDQNKEITLVDETKKRMNEKEMFGVNDLYGDEVIMDATTGKEVEQSTKVAEKEVSTADLVTTAGEVVTTAEDVKAKDKCKGIMVEPKKPLKKKNQIAFDDKVARKLEAQMKDEMEEEERIAKEKDEANIAMIEQWNEVQAKTDADIELAQKLQTKEQKQLTDAKKERIFMKLFEKSRKLFVKKREIEKRNRPPTKAQQRSLMCTYLKNMDVWKPKN
nr:putative ribonuclease H-like domain-containing protein [Tanacetum cinerariifolium]